MTGRLSESSRQERKEHKVSACLSSTQATQHLFWTHLGGCLKSTEQRRTVSGSRGRGRNTAKQDKGADERKGGTVDGSLATANTKRMPRSVSTLLCCTLLQDRTYEGWGERGREGRATSTYLLTDGLARLSMTSHPRPSSDWRSGTHHST